MVLRQRVLFACLLITALGALQSLVLVGRFYQCPDVHRRLRLETKGALKDIPPNASYAAEGKPVKKRKIYRIDPAVAQDSFLAAYPDTESAAVQNAKFLAAMLQKELNITKTSVTRHGQSFGMLPWIYLGYPKCGSSTAYRFLSTHHPCVVKGVNKESAFWNDSWQPNCKIENRRLTECDLKSVVDPVIEFAKTYGEKLSTVPKQGCPQGPLAIDGTVEPLFTVLKWVKGQRVPFDHAIFLKQLLPWSHFIAVVRANDLKALRSHFWYFNRQASVSTYQKTLELMNTTLHQILTRPSRCQAIQDMEKTKAAQHLPALHLDMFPSSCHLRRYQIVFGDSRLHITDVKSIVGLQDGLLDRFLGHQFDRAAVLAREKDIPQFSTLWPSEYDEPILRLEREAVEALRLANWPLLVDER